MAAHFLQFLDKAPVIDIAEGLHGEDCHCIGMQSWITGPGRPDQMLHTDWLPFTLPADILEDGIKAKIKNGVLELTLPRMKPVKPEIRQIEIR